MIISLKLKILLALLFFLATLMLISLLGYRYIQSFADKSRTIMEDNYVSVRYAADMQEKLYLIHEFQLRSIFLGKEKESRLFNPNQEYKEAIIGFEAQLLAAQKNITEVEEAKVIKSIQKNYRDYLASFRKTYNTSVYETEVSMLHLTGEQFIPLYNSLKKKITELQNLNMDAILDKSKTIQQTGESVSFYLSILALTSILITVGLVVILPGYLANPIKELNEKIQEIIDENFDQKLELKYHTKDEVAELAQSFNVMASKLKHYEESNLSKLWFEKKRTESVLRILKKAIVVLDQNQKFLHVNKEALDLIQLHERELIGMHIASVASWNESVKSIADSMMISEVQDRDPKKNQHAEIIRLKVDDIEAVFKSEVSEMYTEQKGESAPQLIGYVILLERVFG